MKRISLLFVIITILFPLVTSAQHVIFEYDQAGNRVLRDAIYLKTTETLSEDNREVEDFNDFLGNASITISPNPNGGKFNVKIEGYDLETCPQIFLHSITGLLIREIEKATSITEIDISDRENGTYILSLIIGTKRKTWKIIKQ